MRSDLQSTPTNGQLPISNCQLEDSPSIGNRKSEIGNSDFEWAWAALHSVFDPEIPVLSIVDMGIVAGLRIDSDEIVVDMTPTFVGCPALDVIKSDIRTALTAAGAERVRVNVVFDPPWTSDRMTDEGRRKLKEFGLAPPQQCHAASPGNPPPAARCPFCDSEQTDLESLFGPTLCRSIHYCRSCLQSFEQFKTISIV